MVTQSLTDQEIEQIFSGVAPEHRDDLAAVVGVVQAMRADVAMEAPRPSDELAALLIGRPQPQPSQAPRPRARTLKRVLAGISGLGLSLQLGLGAAAAAGAVGAAGLAGVLPEPVQHVFDEIVGRHPASNVGAPEKENPPRTTRTSVARLGPEPLSIEPAADDESARDGEVQERDTRRRDRSNSIGRPRTGQVDDAPDRQRTASRPHPDADEGRTRHETDDRRDDTRSPGREVEDGPERDTEDRALEHERREPREPREPEEAEDEDEAEGEDSDEAQVEQDDEVEEDDDVEVEGD